MTAPPVLWQPHAGPQTTFLASGAYECLYGGAAGGGKSHALLFGALRQVDHPQYRALILRRTFPELRELMDQALPVFTAIGASWNSSEKRFRFPSGALVEFGYCLAGDSLVLMADGTHKRIDSIRAGDFVETLEGAKRVVRQVYVGRKESVRITTPNGSVVASADHPVMVEDGTWRTPRDLSRAGCGDTERTASQSRSQGASLPPRWTARLARYEQPHPGTPPVEHGIESRCGVLRDSFGFQPKGLTGHCSSDSHRGDEPPRQVGGGVRAYTPPLNGVGTPCHQPERAGDLPHTLEHTRSVVGSYSHPYTMEARPLCAAYHPVLAEMVPAGEQDLWDISVEGASHYVSYPNLIHRNCETYRDVLQYQGQAFQYIGFDELGQIAEERVWTYLISRNRPTAAGQTLQMRASANPGGPGHHWLKRRFVSACPPDGTPIVVDGFTRAFVAARLRDNPTLMANDPGYGQRLTLLPELERKWLADGDWNAGAGLALDMRKVHLVAPFTPPDHWTLFAALDWGYNHPFSWGLYAVSDDGVVYCLDTATGRHLQPPMIADRFRTMLGSRAVRYTVAGHDVWADVKARSEHVPTLAEQFAAHGFPMVKANISRVAGVQNLRRYLDGDQPLFRLMDTPNNRAVFECLESRVSDPDHPEDVLKVDADQSGQGGDDHYDQVRYALASRPLAAKVVTEMPTKREDRARAFDMESGRFTSTEMTLDKALGRTAPRNPHRVPARKWR